MGYFFLLLAPIALGSHVLCLRYPSIGAYYVHPYPRTRGERFALVIPLAVFWVVLAANAFLPITAQWPFVMWVPPAPPTDDAPIEQWLAFVNMVLLGSSWLAWLLFAVIVALRHVSVDRNRWMM